MIYISSYSSFGWPSSPTILGIIDLLQIISVEMEIQSDHWHTLKKELRYRFYYMYSTLFDLCFSRKIFTCFLFIH